MRDPDGRLVFHALAAPTADEVTEVACRTATRIRKVLARCGKVLDDTTLNAELSEKQLALATLAGVAASDVGLTGKPLLRVVDPEKARVSERVGESLGVNV